MMNTRLVTVALTALTALAVALATTRPCHAQRKRGPFTEPPRSVRSRDFDQQHLRLELSFDWDEQTVSGRSIHTLTPFTPQREARLDAVEMTIEKATLAGDSPKALDFTHDGSNLVIQLDREYQPGETLGLAIAYRLQRPRNGLHFVIPDKDEPSQARMLWTQSEPEYARYWHPCFDSPADRLTSEVIATVPESHLTLSNGTLESRRSNGDGTRTWHWAQRQSHVPYLISIVSGEFEALEQQWDGIPIISYVPLGRLDDAPRSFEKTPQMMDFFSRLIGVRYPWPKYAQICVDEYHWGGMEHTSATTLNLNTLHDERAHLDVSSDNLVAHELAHQWFGNLLTCKDWGEIWLNESFATYLATLWTEHDRGADEAHWERHREAEDYLSEDKGRYRRPIVSYRYKSPDDVFDNHAYPKGARVLHMLRFELGDEPFWRSIRRYVEVHRFRNVETANLRIAIEDATGQGMNWFFDQWIYHGGHPEFHVSWTWDEKSRLASVTVKQTQQQDELTPLFRTSAEIELAMPGETVLRRVTLSKTEETFHFELDERPTRVCFDPNDWLLKELTFPKGKDELLDQLAQDEHIACRVQAAQQLARFTKDQDARDALIAAAARDAFWGVRQEAVKSLKGFAGAEARRALLKAARTDAKSLVRREALKSLASFDHDETAKTLRDVIGKDPSYYAVAEALRTLAKVDGARAEDVLVAALERESHRETILEAALDGLAEIKAADAASTLASLLDSKELSPERRQKLIAGAARMKADDPQSLDRLHAQLDNKRYAIRTAAIAAIEKIGTTASISPLLARRDNEPSPRIVRRIDDAVEKIRNGNRSVEDLRKDLDALRRRNEQLEERLRKLEGSPVGAGVAAGSE